MEDIKDVFVSYGRAESKDFASRLVGKMRDHGLNVWFDQNDIPLGVDFQSQIDDGIEKTHNFVFIIAPHALKSEYCLKEVELAIKRNKRIIPILHIEPNSKEVWEMMHPVVSKLNWVYFREQFEEDTPQEKWKPIDNFEDAFQGLMGVFQMHKEYVQKHTSFLQKALEWERHQKTSEYLLVGNARKEAEKWLLKEFKDQPPCLPTDLHCEYICEARKNGENMMTDVFISYASENREIRDKINRSLARYNITTWLHNKDIKKGEDYGKAIDEGIEQADSFLFFITKESIISEYCLKELDYALKLHKRIIPLLIENIPTKELPLPIKNIQYIDFTDNLKEEDYFQDIDDILKELRKNQRYYEQHKVFLTQALKWERQDKNPSILLRGYNLQNAQAWLKIGKKHRQCPPTAVHEAFINESTAHSGEQSLEVFVSYSRTDGDFARKLNEELQLNGKTTWFDQESIAEGSDFQTEIYRGIELSDNFVFVISPDSVNSEFCVDEVEYAAKLNKRFITLLYRETDPAAMPPDLSAVQWLDFKNKDFHSAFSLLIRTLDTDREHIQNHTKWQQRAMEWETKNKDEALLLRGNEFAVAKAWFDDSLDAQKKPPPTAIQRAFLSQSEQNIFAAQRKEKQTIRKLRVLLVAAVIALVLAVIGIYYAYHKSVEAQNSFTAAEQAKISAQDSERTALMALDSLEEKEIELQAALIEARASKDTAEIRQKEAEIAQIDAQQSQKKAELALLQAEEQKRIAGLKARASLDAAVALQTQKENPTLAMRIIERVYEREQSPSARQIMIDLYGNNDFYSASVPHNSFVVSTDMSPNGKFIATASDYKATFFDTNGKEIANINSDYFINKIRFSPNNNTVALANNSTIASVWDWKEGKQKFELPNHDGSVVSIAFSPDNTKIATATSSGYLYLWDSKGKPIQNLQAHTNQIASLAFSPDSKKLVTGSDDQLAKVWDLETFAPTVLQGHTERVMSVNFSSDSKKVVTGSWDRTSKLWSIEGDLLETYDSDYAYSTVFSPDQSKVLTAGIGNDIKVFSIDGNLIKTLKGHKSPVRTISIAPDGNTVVSGSEDNTLKIWKLLGNNLKIFPEHTAYVRTVAFSPDGKYILSGSDDKTAILREVATGKVLHTLRGHQSDIMCVDFSVTGDTILTAEWGKKIHFWNLKGDSLRVYDVSHEHTGGLYTVKFSPDGNTFLTTSDDNTAKIWSIKRATVRYTFSNHYDLIYSADFSDNGAYLLTSSFDKTAKLWDISRQKEILNIDTYKADIFAVDLSPDGQRILVGGKDNTAHLYDIQGNLINILKGHTTYVLGLAFSPDGQQMITVSGDNTAKLWTKDGQLIKTYKGHTQLIQCLDFSPNGKIFATGSLDKQVRLWQTMPNPEDFLENGNIANFDLHEYAAEGLSVPIEEHLLIKDPEKLKAAAEVYHKKARNSELNDPAEKEALERKAMALLKKAYPNPSTEQERRHLIDAYTNLGFAQLTNLNWKESETNFSNAIQIIEKLESKSLTGSAYVGKFLCEQKKENYPALQRLYNTAKNWEMEGYLSFDNYFSQYLNLLGEKEFSAEMNKKAKMLSLNPYELLKQNLITFKEAFNLESVEKLNSAAYFYTEEANSKDSEDYKAKLANQQKGVELHKKAYNIDKKGNADEQNYNIAYSYANALGWLSWYQLVNKQFEAAIENSSKAMALDPESTTWSHSIMAIAWLFQDKFDDFVAVENKVKQSNYEYYTFQTFQDNVLEYFTSLEALGVSSPNVSKVRQRYMSKYDLLEQGTITKEDALALTDPQELLDAASYYISKASIQGYEYAEYQQAINLQKVALQLYQKSYRQDTTQELWSLLSQMYSLAYYQILGEQFAEANATIEKALSINKTVYIDLLPLKTAVLIFQGMYNELEGNTKEYAGLYHTEVPSYKITVMGVINSLESYYGFQNKNIERVRKDWQTVGQQLQEGTITFEEVMSYNDAKKLNEAAEYYRSLVSDYYSNNENVSTLKNARAILERLRSIKSTPTTEKELAAIYWGLSWYQLLTQDYSGAEISVNRGLKLGAEEGIITNLGPSFLYRGMEKEAVGFYNKKSTQPYKNALFAKVFWEDLEIISPTSSGTFNLLENKIRFILIDAFTKDNTQAHLEDYIDKVGNFINVIQGDKNKAELYKKLVIIDENLLKIKPSASNLTANHYGSYAWYLINNKNYKEAIKAAKRGLKLDPAETWINTNLALSYLLDSQYKEAETIYTEWKDRPYISDTNYETFAEVFLIDLKDLEQKGIIHPDFSKIKDLLEN